MLRVLLVCAAISLGVDLGFSKPDHRNVGKCPSLSLQLADNIFCSLGRGIRYIGSRLCGRLRWIMERLHKGRIIPETSSHQ